MHTLDPAAVAVLAGSTEVRTRLHALAGPTDLRVVRTWEPDASVILSGSLTLDRTRQVRGSSVLTLANSDGALTPSGIGDTFGRFSVLRVEHGVVLPSGTVWLELCTHVVGKPKATLDGQLGLALNDRLWLAQQQFGEPETAGVGSRVGDVIRHWLSPVLGEDDDLWVLDDGGQALGVTAIVAEDDDRLDRATALAADFALELLTDRLGRVVLRPKADPTTTAPVATIAYATNILKHAREPDSEPYNMQVAVGEGARIYRAVAQVTDSASPLHEDRIGRRAAPVIRSAAITSQYQAEQVARQGLLEATLGEDTVTGEVLHDPRLDEGDVVEVSELHTTATEGTYRLDRVTHPLAGGAMRIVATKVQAR